MNIAREIDMGTSPLVADTDGDGIPDGEEYRYINSTGITNMSEITAILHSRDYDHDGLPDHYEYVSWKYYEENKNRVSRYLMLNNSRDAQEDFDNDTLTNLEEYMRNSGGDYDHDGIPDVYDADDDGDGIPTAVELGAGLNPLDSRDAPGDLDHDGLSNLFEYEQGLDMKSNDMDHDGIDDGAELHYWNTTRGLPLSRALEYARNPDVDNDSIPDGKEIRGYRVKIIVGWKEDGTPVSEMRRVSPDEMDPLVPYGYEGGKKIVWTDTDGDGIPDVAEVYLSNRSRWGEFEANYSDLWSEYSWIADYYATIEKRENESAADEWLKAQFNPLVVENTPPVVVKFTVKWRIVVSLNPPRTDVYANVTVLVRDVGGIAYLRVLDENSGDSVILRNAGTSVKVEHNFSTSLWETGFGSVHIKVEAKDYAGNKITVEKELKGALGQVLDALAEVWAQFAAALQRAAEAVARAVDVLRMLILQKIWDFMSGINSLMDSMKMIYQDDIILVAENKERIENTRLYIDANMFGFGLITLEISLAFAADVFTGGGYSTTSMAAELGYEGYSGFIAYVAFKKAIEVWGLMMLGAKFREYLQRILDQENMTPEEKETIIFGFNLCLAFAGMILASKIGTEDIKGIIAGYVLIIFFYTLPKVIETITFLLNISCNESLVNEISSMIRVIIVAWLIILTLNSIVHMGPSDVIAGPIGWADEIILGYLTMDALYSLGDYMSYVEQLFNHATITQ